MPEGIYLPPWLKGIDPGELGRLHAAGLELGQRAAAEQNRTLMAIKESQAREQESAARQAMAQQEIDVQIQKQQAQAQQAQQELELKKQEEQRMAARSAMQFAGQKQFQNIYDQEIQAGSTPEEAGQKAFLGSAHLFMAGAPAATASAIQHFAAPRTMAKPPFTPTTGTLTNPVTGAPIPFMTTGTGSARELKGDEGELNKRKAAQILAPKIRSAFSNIERERKNQVGSKPGKKAYDLAQAEIDRLQNQIKADTEEYDKLLGKRSIQAPPSAPTTPRVRTRIKHKETGRQAWYNGPAEDVPSEYEIVGEEK